MLLLKSEQADFQLFAVTNASTTSCLSGFNASDPQQVRLAVKQEVETRSLMHDEAMSRVDARRTVRESYYSAERAAASKVRRRPRPPRLLVVSRKFNRRCHWSRKRCAS